MKRYADLELRELIALMGETENAYESIARFIEADRRARDAILDEKVGYEEWCDIADNADSKLRDMIRVIENSINIIADIMGLPD